IIMNFYILKEFWHFFPRAIYRAIRPLNDRNQGMVKRNYDERYERDLINFRETKPGLDNYLFAPVGEFEWILIDHKIKWGKVAESYKAFVKDLELELEQYLNLPNATLIEFGCGSGRNLLYLKSRYPQVHFIGLELSPAGVALAKKTALFYGLDVEFREADLTQPLELEYKSDLTFSVHALEQMPRILGKALDNMVSTSNGKIILFEPIPELYPWWTLRGVTSRARARVIDHVRGVLPALRGKGFVIDKAKRLGVGSSLTETCVIIAHKP
ncbi:MAG TPA: class I SAM-dependent methyltransferase, partial [Candidatus Paceibacterota bacterium]